MKIALIALSALIAGSAPLAMAASQTNPSPALRNGEAPRLKRLDTDGDKRISAAEWAAHKGKGRPKAFARLDVNGDGFVEVSELRARAQQARRDRPLRVARAERRAERLEKRAGRA